MIHKPAIPRIEGLSCENNLEVFTALAEEAKGDGNEVGQVCIPLVDEGDEFVVGTWVPELWLVVREVLE